MSKIDTACEWAIQTAKDNRHGYSQASRWGTPDYDCSSFVISAWEQAGVPVKDRGASFTGNMYGAFMACGFSDVTNQISLANGYNLQRGDVLLNDASHTCLYIGNGQVVNCRTDTDGMPGDSHADEIRIQNYWNYPWDHVLRFTDSASAPSEPQNEIIENPVFEIPEPDIPMNPIVDVIAEPIMLQFRDKGYAVGALQMLINYHGIKLTVDQEFGLLTKTAVMKFQRMHGLGVDGIVGRETWNALIKPKE